MYVRVHGTFWGVEVVCTAISLQPPLARLHVHKSFVDVRALFICPSKYVGWVFAWCENFIREKFYLCRLQKKFVCCKNAFHAALAGIVFKYLYKTFQKNANHEEFLTKFVNTNNRTHNFLHGVIIHQDAKICSQHEEIFEAWQELTFWREDKNALPLFW